MLQVDARVGGDPRYILTDEPECLMKIPDEVRKGVVFLGFKNREGIHQLAGTGFFVTRRVGPPGNYFIKSTGPGYTYLVTAKHVIDGIRGENADKVCVRVNFMDGQARWLESDINDWLYHPTESDSVDVALLRCGIAPQLDHNSIGMQGFATPDILEQLEIGVGDDVFLTGLFVNHHGERKNIPIIRVGNIAAMPEEPIAVRDFGYMEAYLVEARSLGGISGSPVFVHISILRALHLIPQEMRDKVTALDNVYYLLGLMHGHWDIMMQDRDDATIDRIGGQRVNMGIAIVVPASKIKEVIEQPMIRKSEDEKEKKAREAQLPTADSVQNNSEFTQNAFENALKRASRKVEPESKDPETSE